MRTKSLVRLVYFKKITVVNIVVLGYNRVKRNNRFEEVSILIGRKVINRSLASCILVFLFIDMGV